MPIPPYIPDNVAHIRFQFEIESAPLVGVGFWTPCTSADPTELSAAALAAYGTWEGSILADQVASCILAQVQFLSYVSGHEYVGFATGSSGGGTAGAGVAMNVAAVISWHELLTYRGGHPRTYVPGCPASAIEDTYNTFSSAYRSALQSEAEAFLTGMAEIVITGSEHVALSTLHRVSGGAPLTPGYLSPLSSPTVKPPIGTQRRRIAR